MSIDWEHIATVGAHNENFRAWVFWEYYRHEACAAWSELQGQELIPAPTFGELPFNVQDAIVRSLAGMDLQVAERNKMIENGLLEPVPQRPQAISEPPAHLDDAVPPNPPLPWMRKDENDGKGKEDGGEKI